MGQDTHIGLRIPIELDKRIQAIQDCLGKRMHGMQLNRSQLIRSLLERGAEALEKELNHVGSAT